MVKHMLRIGLILGLLIFIRVSEPSRAAEPQQLVKGDKSEVPAHAKWGFEPVNLARQICKKNNWQFKGEYADPAGQKYFTHFRFFEIIKPIDESKANSLILVVSVEQKDYLLHQTLGFEEIETKESFYPANKEEAMEMAMLKERLSQDYDLWSPFYSLVSRIVEEDRDNLLWRIALTYSRPALRTLVGPVCDQNEKPSLVIVPDGKSSALPQERCFKRTIQLIHPLVFEIEKLIGLLGNDDWSIREKATHELIAIGRPVVTVLEKEVSYNPDPEVRMRAGMILEKVLSPSQAPDKEKSPSELREVEIEDDDN